MPNQEADSHKHILTIALEDYFHGAAFHGLIGEKSWSRFESRFEKGALAALELLGYSQSRATFFVNAWVARKCPDVLREILRRGHEIALSGDHGPGYRTLPGGEFREKLRRARAAVEEACGHEVFGYRRSDVLLRPKHLGALSILAEEGFLYDSSLSPTAWAFRREPWRRFVHQQNCGSRSIWEFPLSSQSIAGLMFPIAGGNYFRQYPETLVRWAIERWNESEKHPLVLYFRLWDLDPAQPRLHTGSLVRDVRHYRNGDRMVRMIGELFGKYRFDSIAGSLELSQRPSQVRQARMPEAPAVIVSRKEPEPRRVPISVIVPCYNEETSIGFLARALGELQAELARDYDTQFIFVDDGSTDNTWREMEAHFGTRGDSILVRHEVNQGVSAALVTGLRHAREIACSMDCDCSYDPLELKPMLAMLASDVDLVTASPYHPKGRVVNVPRWRVALSRGASVLYQSVTGQRLHTFTSCLRVYRRSAALAIPLHHGGFLGVAELAGKFALGGQKIVEHPATLELRLFGRSKMKVARTVAGHLGLLANLAWLRFKGIPPASAPLGSAQTPAESLTISPIKSSGLNS